MAVVVDNTTDVFRLLIIAGAFFDVGLMLAIHWKTRKAGIIPMHARILGISYLLWLGSCISELYSRFGHHFVWRTAMEGVAVVTGMIALFMMDRCILEEKE